MAPKKIVKTPAYHPLNRKGGKKLGKEVELKNKLQLEVAACKPPLGNKFNDKLVIKLGDPKYANFKDPVKESLDVRKTPESSTPSSCGISANGLLSSKGPDGLPFSPREDPNNKGVQAPPPQCAPKGEASICAQRKRERMKRLAMIGLAWFLFFLLFWWMFKRSIYRFLGYPDEGVDRYGAQGYGTQGYGTPGHGTNGYETNMNRANGYGSTRYGSDESNGVVGAQKYRKKGQMCWFNLPCIYDSEGGYTQSKEKSSKNPKLLAG